MIDSVVDSMIDQGIEQSLQSWDQVLKETSAPLQQCARELIKLAPSTALLSFNAKGIVKKHRDDLIQSIDRSPDEVVDAVQKYVEAKEAVLTGDALKKYTNKKFEFWHKLNEFLGQPVKTVFVYRGRGAQDIVLAEIDSTEVVREDTERHTMRYLNSKNKDNSPSALEQAIAVAREKESKEDKKNSNNLKLTFREVLYRANRFKSEVSKARTTSAIIILWLKGSVWQKMSVSSEGDLSEAYASFYLKKQFNLFKTEMEQNVDTFMTSHPSGVQYVDNISGLLQGDVLADNIEYAIKSAGASVMGDNDILTVAAMIATGEYFTATMAGAIKKTLENRGQYRNKLVNEVDCTIEEILQNLQDGKLFTKASANRAKKLIQL